MSRASFSGLCGVDRGGVRAASSRAQPLLALHFAGLELEFGTSLMLHRRNITMGIAAAALLATGCVRLDVGDAVELGEAAVQLSHTDTVVLCPLAADIVNDSGEVAVAFAGYPAQDDRLQILLARVTMQAQILEAPSPVALLETELSGLALDTFSQGMRLRSVDIDGNELGDVRLDDRGRINPYLKLPKAAGSVSMDAERCEQVLEYKGQRLRVFRSQVDGNLPLFVEAL